MTAILRYNLSQPRATREPKGNDEVMSSGAASRSAMRPLGFTSTARTLKFDAFVVLPDTETKRVRVAPESGVLTVNLTERTISIFYRKKARGQYTRRLDAPNKCVVGEKAVKIWSTQSKTSIMCTFASDVDRERCLEALQVIGTRVVRASSNHFEQVAAEEDFSPMLDASAYDSDLQAIMDAITDPDYSATFMQALASYIESDQLTSDITTISQGFFS